MSDEFFEPLPPPRPLQRHEPSEWLHPPDDEVAALVADRRVLASTDDGLAIVVSHIDVFSRGCTFELRALLLRTDEVADEDWWERQERFRVHGPPRTRRRAGTDGPLRFGLQFGDGSKVMTIGPMELRPDGGRPDGPVLLQHGGSGGGVDPVAWTTWRLWLWPLPPAEPFDLVFSWPTFGLDLERVQVDGAALVDATKRVVRLGSR